MPENLLEQLKPAGRLIMPLGSAEDQQLTLVIKDAAGPILTREVLLMPRLQGAVEDGRLDELEASARVRAA